MYRRLRRVDCAHYVCSRARVETEGSGDARYLTRREHKPNAEQCVLLEHEQSCNEYVAFAPGIVYAALKAGDDEADDVQSPRKVVEKLHDALYPAHLEQFCAHAAHLGEEVSEEAYDLAVNSTS